MGSFAYGSSSGFDPQARATQMVRSVVDGLKAMTLAQDPNALPGHREVARMIESGKSVPLPGMGEGRGSDSDVPGRFRGEDEAWRAKMPGASSDPRGSASGDDGDKPLNIEEIAQRRRDYLSSRLASAKAETEVGANKPTSGENPGRDRMQAIYATRSEFDPATKSSDANEALRARLGRFYG